jgi:hypothetical protein
MINIRSRLMGIPAPRPRHRLNSFCSRVASSTELKPITTYFDASALIAGRLHFGRPALTEPTEHHDEDEVWEFTLDDEDDPECSLVELLAVSITLHVEILNGEAAAFEESGKWSREQRGAELARDDAKRCLALIARRQPDALHEKRISDLFDDAIVEAASEADPDDPDFEAEYTEECGRAASRIMRTIVTHLEAEGRPRSCV